MKGGANEIPFYRTQMGHRFFEPTLSELMRQVSRLNDNLERLVKAIEGMVGGGPSGPVEGGKS